MSKKSFMLLSIILTFALLFGGCNFNKSKSVILSGNIEGYSTNVSSETAGKIVDVLKSEGDTVKAGDMVYKLDDTIYKLQREQADNKVKALEVQLKLAKDRNNDDNIKIAEYNLASARKSVEIIDENIKRCSIYSPADGIITSLNLKKGELAPQGYQLFSVLDNKKYYVTIYVPEKYLSNFKTGESINVILNSFDNMTASGKIVKIDETGQFTPKNTETVDEKSNIVYGIKIDIKNDIDIKPGMIAEVKLDE